MRVDGKTAVVTGGGTGLGRGIAVAFAREGARVAVLGRRPGPLQETADLIGAAGGRALAVPADVADEDRVATAAQEVRDQLGPAQILVCAAGIRGAVGDVTSLATAGWQEALAVNLTGPMLCGRHFIPQMREAGGGSIVHIGSLRLSERKAGAAAYIAAKGGLLYLTQVMALDHAAEGIRVNMLSPGLVLTPFTRYVVEGYPTPEDGIRHWGAQYPLGRIGTESDIANACLFLAGDDAAWITGQVLRVDGGKSLA